MNCGAGIGGRSGGSTRKAGSAAIHPGMTVQHGRFAGAAPPAGGAAAIGVLVILIASGMALGSSPGRTATPPYHGFVVPSDTLSTSGCASSGAISPWIFDLATGEGHGALDLAAGHCPGRPSSGALPESQGVATSEFWTGVDLPKVGKGTSNISVDLGGSYSTTVRGSDGGRSSACSAPVTQRYYNYTVWEWNYSTRGGFFRDYAENYSYEYDGVWSNSSYASSPIPNPFHLNRFTYYEHQEQYAVYAYCEASSYVAVMLSAALYDEHTRSSILPTNASGSPLIATFLEVVNATDWGWTNASLWDGPSNGTVANYTYPTAFFRDNVSLATELMQFSTALGESWSNGTSSSASYRATTSLAGDRIWFEGQFNSTHRYQLELTVEVAASVYDNWSEGHASCRWSAPSPQFGVQLLSISMR